MATHFPIIVIIGPTASGKTALAIELARKYDGEIVCADSRTLYTGMDIGTAKPSMEEREGIPHYGLDLALPSERYTAADFKQYAERKIEEIRAKSKQPIIVGGTGLYVDSLIFDYQFPRPMTAMERERFENMTREDLIKYCVENNINLPEDDKNKRRLLRSISASGATDQRKSRPNDDTIIVGIATSRQKLESRIAVRTEHMFDNGVVEEATLLGKKYGWNAEAMTSNVYRAVKQHLDGELSLQDAMDKFTTRDIQLAKRQMTWFRRNPYIEWCQVTEANDYVGRRLATEYNL